MSGQIPLSFPSIASIPPSASMHSFFESVSMPSSMSSLSSSSTFSAPTSSNVTINAISRSTFAPVSQPHSQAQSKRRRKIVSFASEPTSTALSSSSSSSSVEYVLSWGNIDNSLKQRVCAFIKEPGAILMTNRSWRLVSIEVVRRMILKALKYPHFSCSSEATARKELFIKKLFSDFDPTVAEAQARIRELVKIQKSRSLRIEVKDMLQIGDSFSSRPISQDRNSFWDFGRFDFINPRNYDDYISNQSARFERWCNYFSENSPSETILGSSSSAYSSLRMAPKKALTKAIPSPTPRIDQPFSCLELFKESYFIHLASLTRHRNSSNCYEKVNAFIRRFTSEYLNERFLTKELNLRNFEPIKYQRMMFRDIVDRFKTLTQITKECEIPQNSILSLLSRTITTIYEIALHKWTNYLELEDFSYALITLIDSALKNKALLPSDHHKRLIVALERTVNAFSSLESNSDLIESFRTICARLNSRHDLYFDPASNAASLVLKKSLELVMDQIGDDLISSTQARVRYIELGVHASMRSGEETKEAPSQSTTQLIAERAHRIYLANLKEVTAILWPNMPWEFTLAMYYPQQSTRT